MSSRLTPRSMTFVDLELHKVKFCRNFTCFRDFGR